MLSRIPTHATNLTDVSRLAGDEAVAELQRAAAPLAGRRVLHINSTAFGSGVAETFWSAIPLARAVGVATEWQVIRGTREFFRVTRRLNDALRGSYMEWLPEHSEAWLSVNRQNAELFEGDYDFVIVHDPQPAPLLPMITRLRGERPAGRWFWRCHIDLTDAQPDIWDRVWQHVRHYDGIILSARGFVPEKVELPVRFIAPAIDPLSPKNAEMTSESVESIVRHYGIDPGRPLLLQVSRFDPWKDPVGVIEVYRALKAAHPGLQLAYIASMGADDPEGWSYYERTLRRAGDDPDILILTNLQGVGNAEVNAFQRAAAVVVQKSMREGFGSAVAEALWKSRAVVASDAGGTALQVLDGRTGLVARSNEEFVAAVDRLLRDPDLRRTLGEAGRDHIRAHFLMPRYVRDYMQLLAESIPVLPAPAG